MGNLQDESIKDINYKVVQLNKRVQRLMYTIQLVDLSPMDIEELNEIDQHIENCLDECEFAWAHIYNEIDMK